MLTVVLDQLMIDDAVHFVPACSQYFGITVSGHMKPADRSSEGQWAKGENIACAAVSALVQNLLRSLVIVGGIDAQFKQDTGYMHLTVPLHELSTNQIETARILVHSFYIGIMDVRSQYPDCITIGFSDEPVCD